MRELYKEFFHVPKHGKVREKVMLARTAMTVVIMVICLAAMSITAYAYFSYNVTSGSNIIKAANFEADVVINITSETGEPVAVTDQSNHTKTAQLKAGNKYHIVLDESENSTAGTGFVIVSSTECQDIYHTQQLGNDESVESGYTEKIIFDLSVTADTTVYFVSHWGTSSHYDNFKYKGEGDKLYITNGNTGDNAITMVINGVSTTVSDTGEETTPSESTPTETTPTEVTYTVQSGDTLESIAKEYNTTADKIADYNNLADKNTIVVGQQLKIPPADYEIPAGSTETTTPSTTTTPTESTTVTEPTTTTTVPETTTPPTETTTTTEPTATTAPAETTTETTPETTSTTEPTTTTETQPAATSTEPASTETTGATTTEASE